MADASLLMVLLRLGVSMAVVIALMLVAARVLRGSRVVTGVSRSPKVRRLPIDVSAMKPLTRNAHVAVVRAGGRELVLGITEHQVTLLHSAAEVPDGLDDLDGDLLTSTTTTDDVVDLDAARARIAPAAAAGSPTRELPSGLSAWTDALETLREKTVRR